MVVFRAITWPANLLGCRRMSLPPTSTVDKPPAWHKNPTLRKVVAVVAIGLILLSVYASYRYSQLLSETCAEVPREVLEIKQMGAIRTKVRTWKSEPDKPLVLEGKEGSWVLREVFRMPAHIQITGEQVRAKLAVEDKAGCYNVDYTGTLAVRDGKVQAVPDRLIIGAVDLTPYVGGQAWELGPSWLTGDARKLLRAISSLDVIDGHAHVQLSDPSVIP